VNSLEKNVGSAWARLRFAAWLSVTIHVLAGIGLVAILRHGLASNADMFRRLEFIDGHHGLWASAWLTWNAAALTLLYFYLAFARASESDANRSIGLLRLAVMLTAAAVAVDLSAEAIEMSVMPLLARQALTRFETGGADSALALVGMLDRSAVILSGYVANGLYSLSAILITWSTRPFVPAWIWAAGSATGGCGLVLAAASLADWVAGMIGSTALLIPCIIFWQTAVAVHANRQWVRVRPPCTAAAGDGSQ
jgi:hypothetical protein